MKIARNAIQGASGGIVAGALIGLIEALFLLATTGAPDLLSPFYAVVLYGLIGLPIGLGAGLVCSPIQKFKDYGDGMAWAIGAAGATTPMGLFILAYIVKKVVYAEQGLPMPGLLGILGAVALVNAFWLLGVSRMVDNSMKSLLQAKGLLGTWGVLMAVTGAVALVPVGEDPRANWAAKKAVPEGMGDKPNVLLIMVDTLRADGLGTYGAEGDPSPVIDAMAADGVVFERGYAQASWTRASGASLMTSRLPSGHNAALKASRLPDEVVTWAEALNNKGVTTGALINNINLTQTFNFDQGYDTFIYESPAYPFMATESVFGLTLYKVVHKLNEKIFGANKAVETFYQPAEVVLDDAKGFITANQQARWALFVHLMEPHDPYFEHPYLMGQGSDEFNGTGFARAEVEHPDSSAENIAYLKQVYADEIRHMDKKIAPFFQWMKDEGLYDNTLIVLTADHGEEFFEHGGWWHGTTLYDEQTHVPMIVKLPGQELAGTRVPWQVRSVDVAPTIAAQLGIEPDAGWYGEDLIGDVQAWLAEAAQAEAEAEAAQAEGADGEAGSEEQPEAPQDGVDLAAAELEAAQDEAEAEGEPEIDPCAPYSVARERVVIGEEDFEGNQLLSIRKHGYRFSIANEGNPRGLPTAELFDVVQDEAEMNNLAGTDGKHCGVYLADLPTELGDEAKAAVVDAAKASSSGGKACLDEGEIQKLIALGYMSQDEAASQERCK